MELTLEELTLINEALNQSLSKETRTEQANKIEHLIEKIYNQT